MTRAHEPLPDEHQIVVVVGAGPELDDFRDDLPACIRVSPEEAMRTSVPTVLLVLDLRSYPPSRLATVRHAQPFRQVPAVVVGADEGDPRVPEIEADDVLTVSAKPEARRRVLTLAELGRRRLLVSDLMHAHSDTFRYAVGLRVDEDPAEIDRRRFEHLAAMGSMVAGFAHEIRNPMASLRALAESLNEELVEAGIDLPHVSRMLGVLERVERLVRTSLLFGRPSRPQPSAHSVESLVGGAVASMAPRTKELHGEIAVDVAKALPDVFVDDGQIVQVLVILLNNAIDATLSPSRVTVRARFGSGVGDTRHGRRSEPPSGYVCLDVIDDGPGIPLDLQGRIFDPFFTTRASGTGLGLSIAQQLVSENGGRIELASSTGGPTTLTVVIPAPGAPPSRRF